VERYAGKLAPLPNMVPKWLGVALLVVQLWGCGGRQLPPPPPPPPPCQDPEPVRLYLYGTDRLNPSEHGEPLATVVRIYQLRGMSHISDASFEDMLDRDKQVLAEDWVSTKELTVNPGDQIDPQVVRGDGVNFVAVVALFRQPAGTSWRSILRLNKPDPQHCRPLRRRKPPQNYQAVMDENRVEIR
jgi:type VI secretion system VasD/TssJ family lipoprotein